MLSDDKLAELKESFPCQACKGTGTLKGSNPNCLCDACGDNGCGIDWPAAYTALGKQLEYEMAARHTLALDTIKSWIKDKERASSEK